MKHLLILLVLSLSFSISKAQNFDNLTFGTGSSLEVITWNIQFFPYNDDLTVGYLSQIIPALDADIIAFQEVVEIDVFSQMIDNIDGYDAFTGTTDDLIKLAYVYKTDVIQIMDVYEIYTGSEYFLPFLRRPLVMECMYEGENFVIINNHFKAMGDGILDPDDPDDEENRRWVATNLLKEYVDDNFANENVIIVGDLNDVITDEYPHNVFQSLINDPENYAFADYEIAVGSETEWSYPDYPSHIDHIIITNELFDEFSAPNSIVHTLKIEEHFPGGWYEYKQNISDHRPVGLKLFPDNTVVFSKDFEDQSLTSGGWTTHNVTGAQTWTIPETQYGHNNTYCAYINGYSNSPQENENWFVSPAFSPDEFDNLTLSFWNTSGYSGPGLQLLWSDNFSGDPQTAVWTEIDNVQWHDGNTNWVWTFSEMIDLSHLTGSTAYIAFKYTSTSQQAAAWELDDIVLSSTGNGNNNTYDISASANPPSGGSVAGGGTYLSGETVEMTAMPETNYSFVNWTENGDVVATDADYSFTATQNRYLIANFSTETQNPVKKAPAGLAIDGHLDEEIWEISNVAGINNGGSDNTASFGLLWDDNYLYVGVEVSDNLIINDRRQAFYTDGIEICIDGNHDQSAGFDDNDLQLAKPAKSFWIQEMNMNIDGIIHKYKEYANGYTMEFAIPWSIINTTPVAGNWVGFNLVVNDDDTESPFNGPFNSPTQLIWEGNTNYHVSPQNWGSIQLSAETANFPGSYLALLSHNEGDFLINGKNTNIEWFSHGIDNVKIEYSTDNGNQWITITESTNAAAGVYEWQNDAPASQQFLIRISDVSNSALSDVSDAENIVSDAFASSELLIPSLWHNYMWPYNAYYPEDENGINGHLGNGCGPSTLSRLLHSREFPRQGRGSLNFTDFYGNYWSADFENTIYNYDNMPNHLFWEATEPEYTDVATLMAHTAVASNDYYGSGTDLENFSYLLSNYFSYKESEIAYMHDYTPAQWTQLLKNEIDNGRSLVIQAMNLNYFDNWHTNNNVGGHWYHCDGYNEDGEFHIIVGFGNYQYDGYYSIEEFPIFSYNVGILTGLEPDMDGKTLALTQPNGDEAYTIGDEVEISWQSSGISNLQIEYTLDNGQNWIEIDAAADAAAGSYLWMAPESNSDQCKIRLTDTGNINVYDKSEAVFNIMDTQLALDYPTGGESFVFDNIALITWQATPVAEVDLEFSSDNGNTWNDIVSGFDASQGQYQWEVPQNATHQGLIRIYDSQNNSNTSVSNTTFSIVPQNMLGGPYTNDENTLLLLHGEVNLFNQSDFTGDVNSADGTISYADNPVEDMGKSIYLDNSSGSPYLVVPHTADLNLTSDWTLELWFKPVAYKTGLQYFIWKPGDDDEYFSNFAMQLNEFWGNELYGFYFSGEDRIGVRTEFFPQLNQWYHLAFIRNTENSSLSVIVRDAQREIINSYTFNDNGGTPLTNSQDLKIGFNFNGYVDEIRISDIVRTFESQNSFLISASVSPVNSGTVSGTGNYIAGEDATIIATPGTNYEFVNWTENETEVSSDATYSFTVTENRTLKANFSIVTDVFSPEREDWVISPNPAKDFIRMNNSEKIDFQIFLPTGTCVATHENINPNDLINISGLNSGIYFVLIEMRNNIVCRKLIIRN